MTRAEGEESRGIVYIDVSMMGSSLVAWLCKLFLVLCCRGSRSALYVPRRWPRVTFQTETSESNSMRRKVFSFLLNIFMPEIQSKW